MPEITLKNNQNNKKSSQDKKPVNQTGNNSNQNSGGPTPVPKANPSNNDNNSNNQQTQSTPQQYRTNTSNSNFGQNQPQDPQSSQNSTINNSPTQPSDQQTDQSTFQNDQNDDQSNQMPPYAQNSSQNNNQNRYSNTSFSSRNNKPPYSSRFGSSSDFGRSKGSLGSRSSRYGSSFGSNSNSKNNSKRLTPEERVSMIERVYQEILHRKPDTRDINYYKYSTLNEEQIKKQLLASSEHKDLIKKGREYKKLKDQADQSGARTQMLEGKIKDQLEEFKQLNQLLQEKNRHIRTLRDKLSEMQNRLWVSTSSTGIYQPQQDRTKSYQPPNPNSESAPNNARSNNNNYPKRKSTQKEQLEPQEQQLPEPPTSKRNVAKQTTELPDISQTPPPHQQSKLQHKHIDNTNQANTPDSPPEPPSPQAKFTDENEIRPQKKKGLFDGILSKLSSVLF